MNTTTMNEFQRDININVRTVKMLEQEYGFTHQAAEGIAAAINAQDTSRLATKEDLKDLKIDLIKWMAGLFMAQIGIISGIMFTIIKFIGY